MIRGVNHVTFAVADLERSLAFYEGLLGMRLAARWPRGAYLRAGTLWVALVVDDATREGPLPEYTHLAFDVAPEDFEALAERVAAEVEPFQENRSEGASLYFLDPDGHKLELHASDLDARLAAARQAPWEGLEILEPDPAAR